MDSDEDEVPRVTCHTDPTKNCTCAESCFCQHKDDSSDDSLEAFTLKRGKVVKRTVAARRFNLWPKRNSLTVWRRIDLPDFDSNIGVCTCERFSDSPDEMAKSSSKKTHHIERGSSPENSSQLLKKNVNRKMQSHDLSSSDESGDEPSSAKSRQSSENPQEHLLSSEGEMGGNHEYLLTSEDEKSRRKHKKRDSSVTNGVTSVHSQQDNHSSKEDKISKKLKGKDRIRSSSLSNQDGVSPEKKEKSKHKRKDSVSSSSSHDVTLSEKEEKLSKKHKKRDSVSSSSIHDVIMSGKEEKPSKKYKRRDSTCSSSDDQIGSSRSLISSQNQKEEKSSKKPVRRESISSNSDDQIGSFSQNNISAKDEEIFKKPRNRDSVSSSSEDIVNNKKEFLNPYKIKNTARENITANTSSPATKKVYHDEELTQDEEEEVAAYSELFGESFLKKNNVWLLQCPSSVDCSQLVKQSLDLDNNGMLLAGDTKYETLTHRSDGEKYMTLAVPSSQHNMRISRIPIAGSIVVEEYVGIEDSSDDFFIPDSSGIVQLPENLRTRHPLLGLDYEQQSKTPEIIKKKTKKNKRHSSFPEGFVHVPIKVEKPDYDSTVESSPKKKKKRKRESDFSLEEAVAGALEEIPSKKLKTELPEVAVKVEYDSAVECTPKKSKKRKRESDISPQESELSTLEQSPKKKKKRKSEFPHGSNMKEESYEEPLSEKEEKPKKKKKKLKSEDSL